MAANKLKDGFSMKSVCMLVQNHYDMDIRVRRKAEALVAAGYSVDVLALASSRSTSKNYTLSGVNVYTVSLAKKRGSLVRYAYEYLAFLLWSRRSSSSCLLPPSRMTFPTT